MKYRKFLTLIILIATVAISIIEGRRSQSGSRFQQAKSYPSEHQSNNYYTNEVPSHGLMSMQNFTLPKIISPAFTIYNFTDLFYQKNAWKTTSTTTPTTSTTTTPAPASPVVRDEIIKQLQEQGFIPRPMRQSVSAEYKPVTTKYSVQLEQLEQLQQQLKQQQQVLEELHKLQQFVDRPNSNAIDYYNNPDPVYDPIQSNHHSYNVPQTANEAQLQKFNNLASSPQSSSYSQGPQVYVVRNPIPQASGYRSISSLPLFPNFISFRSFSKK